MSYPAAQIQNAQNLLRDKVMAKLRANPNAWGKVTVELTIQDGKIQNISATDHETIKPNPNLPPDK
jgi:hypothetical protein